MTTDGRARPSFLRNPRLALPLFFLRSFYFQPAANPVLPVVLAFLLFFWAEGSLDRLHLALLLYLFVPAHMRAADPFGGDDPEGEGGAVRRAFRALPVRPERLFSSYLVATAVYAAAVWALIAFGVDRFSRPPDWTSLQMISTPGRDGDTIRSWVGFAQNARGVYRFATRVIERSFLYDTAGGVRAAAPLLSAFFLASFLHQSIYRIGRGLGRARRASLSPLHALPAALYMLLGAAFLAEISLDRAETAAWVRALLERAPALGVFLALSLTGTVLSAALLFRSVRRDLRGGAS
ncbi:MAG: hypothetical protein JW958_01420 [Candidatus Eisenbacteria bacterium]|nr:hypothetical protein [Candidatus Eisenbacteria bacterium]